MKVPFGVLTAKNAVQFTVQGRVPAGASSYPTGAVALPYAVRILDVYYALRGTNTITTQVGLQVLANGTALNTTPLAFTPNTAYVSGRIRLDTEGRTFPAGTVFSASVTLPGALDATVGLTIIGEIREPGS